MKTIHYWKFTTGPNNAMFELYWSTARQCPRVRLIEPDDSPNWDYDDETEAQLMTAQIAACRTLARAADVLLPYFGDGVNE